MSLLLTALVLAGLLGVPLGLLWSGREFRRLSARGQRCFRGSVIGYGLAAVVSIAVLLWPPYPWPPTSTPARWWLVGGLLVGPALGALLASAVGSRDE